MPPSALTQTKRNNKYTNQMTCEFGSRNVDDHKLMIFLAFAMKPFLPKRIDRREDLYGLFFKISIAIINVCILTKI